MTRRASQILALIVLSVLVTVAVWYQTRQDFRLQGNVLNNTGYYGTSSQVGYSGTGSTTGSVPMTKPPEDFDSNDPQFRLQEGNLEVLKYLVPFDELVVLDALQVTTHVPSFTTPVRWVPDASNAVSVVIDDDESTRTAFLAPDNEGELLFSLEVANSSGDYAPVARYEFLVLSPLAYAADVNKDGVYDFQNDLVNLLRNWNSFGDDATRTLALILSRLEDDDSASSPQ